MTVRSQRTGDGLGAARRLADRRRPAWLLRRDRPGAAQPRTRHLRLDLLPCNCNPVSVARLGPAGVRTAVLLCCVFHRPFLLQDSLAPNLARSSTDTSKTRLTATVRRTAERCSRWRARRPALGRLPGRWQQPMPRKSPLAPPFCFELLPCIATLKRRPTLSNLPTCPLFGAAMCRDKNALIEKALRVCFALTFRCLSPPLVFHCLTLTFRRLSFDSPLPLPGRWCLMAAVAAMGCRSFQRCRSWCVAQPCGLGHCAERSSHQSHPSHQPHLASRAVCPCLCLFLVSPPYTAFACCFTAFRVRRSGRRSAGCWRPGRCACGAAGRWSGRENAHSTLPLLAVSPSLRSFHCLCLRYRLINHHFTAFACGIAG